MKRIILGFILGSFVVGVSFSIICKDESVEAGNAQHTMTDIESIGFRLDDGSLIFVAMKREPDYLTPKRWGWVYATDVNMNIADKRAIPGNLLEAGMVVMEATSDRSSFYLHSPDEDKWIEFSTRKKKFLINDNQKNFADDNVFIRADIRL